MFVALGIQHATRMRHIILSSVAFPALPYVSTSRHDFFDVEYIYGFVMLGVCTASRWRHRATIPAYRHACARNTVTL